MAKKTNLDRARAQLAKQLAWIEKCGGDLEGYVARYGSRRAPKHTGDGGELIYQADQDVLHRAQAEVRRLHDGKMERQDEWVPYFSKEASHPLEVTAGATFLGVGRIGKLTKDPMRARGYETEVLARKALQRRFSLDASVWVVRPRREVMRQWLLAQDGAET